MLNRNWPVWRIIIIAVGGAILSVGGWVFSEVRDLPATYATIEHHDTDNKARASETKEVAREIWQDLDTYNTKQEVRQQRIEDKIDETNRFLRNHFSRIP